jgi:hypothetical protein
VCVCGGGTFDHITQGVFGLGVGSWATHKVYVSTHDLFLGGGVDNLCTKIVETEGGVATTHKVMRLVKLAICNTPHTQLLLPPSVLLELTSALTCPTRL